MNIRRLRQRANRGDRSERGGPVGTILRAGAILILLFLALTLLQACGGGSDGAPFDPDPPPAPARVVTVMVDEAHHNLHSLATGTLDRFSEILRDEGLTPIRSSTPFRRDSLERGFLLVVSNALHASNVDDWALPTPSAFTPEEIEAVRGWVEDGGALLLIADHMPFPGAAGDLAAAFGAELSNGFAFDTATLQRPKPCLEPSEIQVFRRADGTLASHPITAGIAGGRIDSVATFTGQAFRVPGSAEPLMTFGAGAVSLLPEEAWVFTDETPRIPAEGRHQGAVLEFGSGRVALFGEAAMFTAQTCGGGTPMGMNAPAATQNADLVRNLVRWLGGEG